MITKLTDVEEIEVLAVLRTLKQVVAEAGDDHVYEKWQKRNGVVTGQCMYVKNGEPDCLAGRVLARMGTPIEVLHKYEGRGASQLPNLTELHGAGALMEPPRVQLHQPALSVLNVAQSVQDRGNNWGDARDAALLNAYNIYGIKVNQ